MRRCYLRIFAALIGLAITITWAIFPLSTDAEDAPYADRSPTFTWNDIPPIQSSGSLSVPQGGTVSWSPGARPENLFTLGMLRSSFGYQNLSIANIEQLTGQPVTNAPLADFSLVHHLSVLQLMEAIPGLGELPVNAVPPIARLAEVQGMNTDGGWVTIANLAPVMGGVLGQLGPELMNFDISQIPGLSTLPLGELPEWAQAQIAQIPGLSQIPLINPLSLKDYFVPFDIPFGMSPCKLGGECREFNIDNTASGNWKNMSIPCTGGPCSHIEVTRWAGDTNRIRWVSKEQQVPGGNGFLCDEEPTGRFPFGKNPKVVVEQMEEDPGEVDFALYFSVDGPFGLESAHCFGPFPLPFWGTRREGELILFGPDKLSATSALSSFIQPPPLPGGTGKPPGHGSPPPQPVDCGGKKLPYIRPTPGPVTSEFGMRVNPVTGVYRLHAGIDLGDGSGTPIAAANCGVVTYASWVSGYGNYTCISHGSGVETCCAHQNSISARVGASVKRGQVIGTVGSTGNSTGPHLHFEYRINGSPVDPRRYVPI